jgi:hypothetical protein
MTREVKELNIMGRILTEIADIPKNLIQKCNRMKKKGGLFSVLSISKNDRISAWDQKMVNGSSPAMSPVPIYKDFITILKTTKKRGSQKLSNLLVFNVLTFPLVIMYWKLLVR